MITVFSSCPRGARLPRLVARLVLCRGVSARRLFAYLISTMHTFAKSGSATVPGSEAFR
jgi:hypothetical protein